MRFDVQEHLWEVPAREAFLWRYMDVPKLVSLLHTEALWMSSATMLGDPHEGSFGELNELIRPVLYGDVWEKMKGTVLPTYRALPRHTYVSCWHMGEHESMAMWSIYAARGQGVAVRTTYGSLEEATHSEATILAGCVNYVDRPSAWIQEGSTYAAFTVKDLPYEYEHEFRLLRQEIPRRSEPEPDDPGKTVLVPSLPGKPGMPLPVATHNLIESIWVAPNQPTWFFNAVEAVVEKFGLECELRRSMLDREPRY